MKDLYFENVSRYVEQNMPVTVLVPYAKGMLRQDSVSNLKLWDDKHLFYPMQSTITGTHEDGSVRYLTVDFLADFQPNKSMTFHVGLEGPKGTEKHYQVVSYKKGILSNRYLSIQLGTAGTPLFSSITYQGKIALPEGSIIGPIIYGEHHEPFTALVGNDGWHIRSSGQNKICLETKGRHQGSRGSWFDFIFKVTLWAESRQISLQYQIINTEKSRTNAVTAMKLDNEQAGLKYDLNYHREMLSGIVFTVTPPQDAQTTKTVFTSSFNAHATEADWNGELHALVDADTIVNTANEMFPEVMFSTFGCIWKSPTCLIGGEIYQAYQNFPKAIDVNREGMKFSFYPESYTPIEIPQGVAKTTTFFLAFYDLGTSRKQLIDSLLLMEMGPAGFAATTDFIGTGTSHGELSTSFSPATERFLYRFVDNHAKGLGFLCFGDCPEWEYVKQGRSGGRDIWINNEYDMPHDYMVMLERSGDRRYYDYLRAAVRHWMDVDFCHFSELPNHEGLLYTHSVNHVSGQPVPSHQWVQGFFDYYHLTGDDDGYYTALAIGNALEKLVKLPMYHVPGMVEPREIGWAIRNFVDLYVETHDEKWLEDCAPIADTYVRWADELGSWTSPYPDNYLDRVPFMMQVGIGGMYAYYLLKPSEKVKKTLLTIIDDIITNCWNPRTNMFLGKLHPSIRFQNLNGMVLETLAIGYALTGETAYLEKGRGMFLWITKENMPPIYDFSKVKRDAFTVIYNCPIGPKRFAQTLIPLLRYYDAAMDTGVLQYEP
ncbi:MAG: hypothetical protein MR519_01605 [Spirochaetaceae bacterium]|nr:hypothetical protein [Spirochaetaceae bacterium]